MKLILLFLITNISFPQLDAKLIATNLEKPLYVTNFPNDNNKLILIEQEGIVKIVNEKIPFLDISDRVHQPLYPADEMGMLGLTFDPNFIENKTFYVHYNDKDNNTIISSFKTINDYGDINSEKVLLKVKQPYPNHNGGSIEFGNDGYLYIGLGDGGSAGDPENRAQDCSNLFGKILRIDVSNRMSYSIPEDNPFKNDKVCKEEIWSYGLRNPWRFTFDKLTGDMYIGDVGQNNWEEIDFESHDSKGGLNFGWKILEGTHCYPKDDEKCNKEGTTPPLFEYPNDANYLKTIIGFKQSKTQGCSVTGGYVYRGKNIPELYGRYFFGDYCTGKVWSIDTSAENLNLIEHTQELLDDMNKRQFYLSSFGEDENGELYLIDYNGDLYSITK
tara:strand:- start:1699 stop:2859 length:1161 start_codon:yes stop_codon:yes gene_type:complete